MIFLALQNEAPNNPTSAAISDASVLLGSGARSNALVSSDAERWASKRRLPLTDDVEIEIAHEYGADVEDEQVADFLISKVQHFVNPMAWRAAPPHMLRGESGGLEAPWTVLRDFYDLPELRPYVVGGHADADCLAVAAERVWRTAAIALRRLTRNGALTVVLDVGDVVSLPARLRADRASMQAVKGDAQGVGSTGAAALDFDRIHLSNVPDHVRARLATHLRRA